ncbi:MAG: hypothetical protein HQL72_05150 [Magnetococcales bacterium]|nr:hypothetical protein [Magnetococcales bacterium]
MTGQVMELENLKPMPDVPALPETVLPWEDADAYRRLLDAIKADHDPQGATEAHLVEELAGIVWRKRRLAMAERATFHRGLKGAITEDAFDKGKVTRRALVHLDSGENQTERPVDAVRATARDTARDRDEMKRDRALTVKALAILKASKAGAYDRALKVLDSDTMN